ncbi:GDP-mannose 4,6-dehydratase [Deferribacter abyssi]
MSKKVALITGITGQDGAYLAEFLLSKGYEVHGIKRRSSLFNTERIDHLYQDPHEENVNFFLHYGDLTDSLNLTRLIQKIQPDEIYNLAAQSHVAVSFEQPEYTANADGIGTLRILEAVRLLGLKDKTKIYQASTSELYGKVQEIPQNEKTPFYPRSPYGVAKLYAYWITVNYREAYGMFACNGILFNHESVPKNSPLIIKKDGLIDILPIEDLFKTEKHRYEGMLKEYEGCEVWNGEEWTKIVAGTCYQDKNKKMKLIQTRESSYEATYEHISFLEDNSEIETKDIKIGDKVFRVKYPESIDILSVDKDLAKFLGFVVGDGYIGEDGRIRLTGSNKELLIEIANIISNIFGWSYRVSNYGAGGFETSIKDIYHIDINNDRNFGLWLRKNIYTKHSSEKRVPKFILNAKKEIKKAFFDGYYLADGRKEGHEKYEYKGFTTKSATLCLGLMTIFKSFSNRVVKVKTEYKNKKRYYYVQFRSENSNGKGEHLKKELNEVIKVIDTESEDGWFFDIQTESGTFATGPNLFKVHNSPIRGETFVTRKITRAATRILLGLDKKLYLGNLNAKRDWGHAKDYVEGMWLILQQDEPDDYVLATGKTTEVREFVRMAFAELGLEIEFKGKGINEKGSIVNVESEILNSKLERVNADKNIIQNLKSKIQNLIGKVVVEVDPRYFRPAEVDILIGDATKAREKLGWQPKHTLEDLVKDMIISDLEKNYRELVLKNCGFVVPRSCEL